MPNLSELVQQGAANLWVFIPTAMALGALHGLEPGHSKTMMAAFIIAVRGTVGQAVLLGISAALSHSLVVWVVAAVGLHYGPHWDAETTEPYLQLASAAIITGLAIWMFFRTRRDVRAAEAHAHENHHAHGHHHSHGHHEEHGHHHGHEHHHEHAHHHAQEHTHDGEFREGEPRHAGLAQEGADFQDAHERAHALDLQRRFTGRTVTTGQIVVFGLTGGLMPCPAAVTVLLICLQLKKLTLGLTLVLAFSFGLAVTMVTVGVVAALSVHHAEKRFAGFGRWMRQAPYVSVAVLLLIAGYMAANAVETLAGKG